MKRIVAVAFLVLLTTFGLSAVVATPVSASTVQTTPNEMCPPDDPSGVLPDADVDAGSGDLAKTGTDHVWQLTQAALVLMGLAAVAFYARHRLLASRTYAYTYSDADTYSYQYTRPESDTPPDP